MHRCCCRHSCQEATYPPAPPCSLTRRQRVHRSGQAHPLARQLALVLLAPPLGALQLLGPALLLRPRLQHAHLLLCLVLHSLAREHGRPLARWFGRWVKQVVAVRVTAAIRQGGIARGNYTRRQCTAREAVDHRTCCCLRATSYCTSWDSSRACRRRVTSSRWASCRAGAGVRAPVCAALARAARASSCQDAPSRPCRPLPRWRPWPRASSGSCCLAPPGACAPPAQPGCGPAQGPGQVFRHQRRQPAGDRPRRQRRVRAWRIFSWYLSASSASSCSRMSCWYCCRVCSRSSSGSRPCRRKASTERGLVGSSARWVLRSAGSLHCGQPQPLGGFDLGCPSPGLPPAGRGRTAGAVKHVVHAELGAIAPDLPLEVVQPARAERPSSQAAALAQMAGASVVRTTRGRAGAPASGAACRRSPSRRLVGQGPAGAVSLCAAVPRGASIGRALVLAQD